MSMENTSPGIGFAAEFQSSALPYVTSSQAPAQGSPSRIDFPKVTRFITISNRDTTVANSLSFGFTQNGVVAGNKFILLGTQTITLELRVKELWVQGEGTQPAYSLCAGLTNVDRKNMPILTGSIDGTTFWLGVG